MDDWRMWRGRRPRGIRAPTRFLCSAVLRPVRFATPKCRTGTMPLRCALKCAEILSLMFVARFCVFRGETACSVSMRHSPPSPPGRAFQATNARDIRGDNFDNSRPPGFRNWPPPRGQSPFRLLRVSPRTMCESCELQVRVNLPPRHRTEHVLEHVRADLPSQARTRVLVEPEVNSAIDAGIVDVIGNLFPRRVVQHHVGH
jgi:hypothetical protein